MKRGGTNKVEIASRGLYYSGSGQHELYCTILCYSAGRAIDERTPILLAVDEMASPSVSIASN